MNTIVYIVAYLICSTFGLLILKTSAINLKLKTPTDFLVLISNYKFLAGFVLYAASFLVWLLLLSKKDLSYIYPVVIGLSYFSVMLASVIFLRESFTFGKIIGIFLIGIGIVVIYIQK